MIVSLAGLPPSVPPYQRGEGFAGIVNSSAATDAGARHCLARRSTPLGPPVSTGGRFRRDCQLVCGDGCRGAALPRPQVYPPRSPRINGGKVSPGLSTRLRRRMQGRGIASLAGLPPSVSRINGGKVSPRLSTRLRRRMQGRFAASPAGLPPSVPPYQRGEGFAGIVNSSAATDAGARHCLARRSTPSVPPYQRGEGFAGIVNSSAATDVGARHCLARRSTPLGPPYQRGKVSPRLSTRLRRRMQGRFAASPA